MCKATRSAFLKIPGPSLKNICNPPLMFDYCTPYLLGDGADRGVVRFFVEIDHQWRIKTGLFIVEIRPPTIPSFSLALSLPPVASPCPRLQVPAPGCKSLPLVASPCPWLQVPAPGCKSLPLGCKSLPPVASPCPWLQVPAPGCKSLPPGCKSLLAQQQTNFLSKFVKRDAFEEIT